MFTTIIQFTAITNYLKPVFSACLTIALFSGFSTTASAADKDIAYHKMQLEGWTVYIEQKLVNDNDKRVFPALKILSNKLSETKKLLPSQHLPSLIQVPIWISENTGGLAEFYFFDGRVYRNERNPKKIGGIEIQNIDLFLSNIDVIPMLLIHELAHAYHKLNYKKLDKKIMDAFRNARWEKLYKDVRLGRSLHRENLYASTSPFEYFAELSEAYFGYSNMFPHTREELKKHDPVGYKMVEEAWEVN